jgi:hypothetical protein
MVNHSMRMIEPLAIILQGQAEKNRFKLKNTSIRPKIKHILAVDVV